MKTRLAPKSFNADTEARPSAVGRMRDFVLPLHPEGLLEDNLSDHYQVEKENAPPLAPLSEKQQISFLTDVAKRLDLSPAHICEQKNFDTLYFCVRHAPNH